MTLADIVAYLSVALPDQRRAVLRRLVPLVAEDDAVTRTVVTTISRCGLASEVAEVVRRVKVASEPKPSPWTAAVVARFGVDTDSEIARDLRLSTSAVAQQRRRRGIPRSPKAALEPRRWTAVEDKLLGTMSDRDAGREIGVSREAVERRRVALGIPGIGWGATTPAAELVGAKYAQARRRGMKVARIAREHRVSRESVVKALFRYDRRLAKPQRVSRRR